MADNFRKLVNGVRIVPKTGTAGTELGDIEVNSSDNKLYLHDGSSSKAVPTTDSTDLLKNKQLEDSTTEIVDNSDNTKKLSFELGGATTATETTLASSQTANRTITLPDATTTLVGTAVSQTLSNKTIDNSNSVTVQDANLTIQDNGDNTKQAKFEVSGITTGTTRTYSLPDANTSLVGNATSQTLSNKTLDNSNTITVQDANLTIQDNADATKQAKFEASGITAGQTRTLTIPDASTTLVGTAVSQTLSNKTLDNSNVVTVQDSNLTIQDNSDNTKQLKIEASGISTATTRTLTAPDANTTIVGTDAAQVITNKDIDGGTASNTSRITLPKAAKATLDALTRKEATLVYASDTDKVYYDDGVTLNEVGSGSGSGGINYILNPDAETNTDGWATYADAAASRPVDGTGGSANVTYTRSTTSPLRGVADFNLAKDAANRQGQGASYAFTIDSADKGKLLGVEFDCELVSGTYSSGTTSTDSDLVVVIYDVTNAVNLEPIPLKLSLPVSGTTSKFYATFPASNNSTSYRLCVHVATTSASAYTVAFDSFRVGPVQTINQVPMTDWTSYTPTFAGLGTVASIDFQWRRVGDSLEVIGRATTGTTTAALASFTLPSGLVIDTAKTPSVRRVGAYARSNANAEQHALLISTGTSTDKVYFSLQTGSFADMTPRNGSDLFGPEAFSVHVTTIPIAGWSSNVTTVAPQVQGGTVGFRTRVSPTGTLNSSFNDVVYPSVVSDSSGSYNTSTGKWTCPVTGYYDLSGQFLINGTFTTGCEIIISLYNETTSTLIKLTSDRYPNSHAANPFQSKVDDKFVFIKAGEVIKVQSLVTGITSPTFNSDNTVHGFSASLVSAVQQIPADSKTRNVRNVSTTATILPTDDYVFATASSGYTLTLPAVASVPGKLFEFEKTDANSNAIAISGTGLSGVSLFFQGAYAAVLSDGTNYYVVKTNASGQIQFPATQVASSDANTLDDYEEGTWTPAANGVSVTVTSATYTKIGRMVAICADVAWPATANTNQARLSGLPFTAAFDAAVAIGFNNSNTAAHGNIQSSTIFFYVDPSNGGTTVTNANFTGATIRVSGVYFV